MSKKDKKKTKTTENQVELLQAQLARTLADYDNLSKRVERKTLELGVHIRSQFLVELLPAIEMLYAVQSHLNDPGLALSIKQFEDTISEQGIEKVEPKAGDDFDENLHEAVEVEENEKKSGKIAELSQKGWKSKDGSVIQHAKVKVFK